VVKGLRGGSVSVRKEERCEGWGNKHGEEEEEEVGEVVVELGLAD